MQEQSKHRHPLFESRLKREFGMTAPDRVWADEITYLWTREGWLCQAVVIDWVATSGNVTNELMKEYIKGQMPPGLDEDFQVV